MRLGIDEAGRGSVLGPMVVAGVLVDEEGMQSLERAGVKDSKRISPQKRERLFPIILSTAEAVGVVKVWPEEIDSSNLNTLTYRAVITIVRSMSPFKPEIVTVDRVGEEWEVVKEVESLGSSPRVTFHADEEFIEVSAASIVAKVVRDSVIGELKRNYGNFGSGYPSDERTLSWIAEMAREGELPWFVRRSWFTIKRIAPHYHVEKGSQW